VRIQTIEFEGECDRPTQLVPPECDSWAEDVFDPTSQTITGWLEGPFAADITIIVPLMPDEVSELLDITSQVQSPSITGDDDSISMKTNYLGERQVDGIRASGVRTTFIYPAGYRGNKSSTIRIHEVWTSPEIDMPIRVIDGDPKGKEIVSGLEKISLTPVPNLFQGPSSYSLQRPTHLDESVRSVYIERFTDFYSH
jgi:hypothetical protein